MSKKISFIGLGAMGSRIAKKLIEAGFDVTVCNRTEQKAKELEKSGARFAKNPKEAAIGGDVVFTMVTDDAASKEVWLNPETGALAGMEQGRYALDLSTLSIGWTKELSDQMKLRKIRFLEAPVIGSRPHVEAKQLTVLLAGEIDHRDELSDLLSAFAAKTIYVGEAGKGAAFKLAVNSLFAIQSIAFAEMIRTLSNSGVNGETISSVLSDLAVTSPVMKVALDQMVRNSFEPLFPIDLVTKDLQYAERLIQSVGVSSVMVTEAKNVFQTAKERGFGKDNISGIIQYYGESAT